ncbi:MAG: hypothetical protein AAFO01_11050 [Pseudomonadota bacterium]
MKGFMRHFAIGACALGAVALVSACSSSDANDPQVNAADGISQATAAADRAVEAADRAADAAQRAEAAAAAAAEAAEKSNRIAQQGLRK